MNGWILWEILGKIGELIKSEKNNNNNNGFNAYGCACNGRTHNKR